MISVTPEADLTPKPVKVLVAEDEVLVRLMVAEVLRGEDFTSSRLPTARKASPS